MVASTAPLLSLLFLFACSSVAHAVPIVGVTSSNTLVRFDSATPNTIISTTAITGLPVGEEILAIDFRPATGQLLGLGSTSRLYIINAATGAAMPIGASGAFSIAGASFGFDFNPTVDRIRVVSNTGQNLRLNPNNGTLTATDGTLAYAASDVNAGQVPNVVGSAYTNSVFNATMTTLYGIDAGRNVLVTQIPPNSGTLNTVGALGVDPIDILGFDIAPGMGPRMAFAALRTMAAGSGLYTINLMTGAATLVGNIGGDEIRGLAVEQIVPTIYAVTQSNRLVSFSSATPGATTGTPITGLLPGETVLGIDFRPANGMLYALVNTGRLYTIDPLTAAATFRSTLIADPTDTTSPFIALAGSSFGVDFNPVPDRLRVTSNGDQNLRINVDTGATITDGTIAYATGDFFAGQDPNLVGSAYTNSVAGTTTTALYGIDHNLNTLVLQNPPNNGTLQTVGFLNADVSVLVGFDIAPGNNQAFASFQLEGGPASMHSLYSVNLASGATQLIGNINAGELITGLAIAPQGTFQFNAATASVQEDCTSVQITVTRTGDTTQPATVEYFTENGTATDRSDYIATSGTIMFDSNQTSRTFRVLINEDSLTEGPETFNVRLRNATGGFSAGTTTTSVVTITDDAVEPTTNAIDDTTTFVCQQYHDFLNRDPDADGLAFWVNNIESCGMDMACRASRRVDTSAAFFLSIEFQQTGYVVYRTYRAAFGNIPGTPIPVRIADFLPDVQQISRGVIIGQPGAMMQLEANTVAYFNQFVMRPRFMTAYPMTLTNAQYVDMLNTNTGGALSPSERDALVNGLNNGTETRATVLRKVVEDATLIASEFNRAFVLEQYFGYLRRDPDAAPDANFDGYNFWLNKLNQFNGDFRAAEMVRAFITSAEYRGRFGTP